MGAGAMMINPRDEYITKKARQEGMEKGIEEGKKEVDKKVAIALIKKGMPLKEISEVTKLTEKQIENLKVNI